MNFFRKLSMTNQLLVPIALISTAVLLVLGLVSSRQIYSEARSYAVANSLETSRRYAEEIRAFINKPFAQIEILGRSLSTQVANHTQSRQRTYLDLKDLLASDPGYLATWSAWEPDAFDGRDSEFKNKELHEQSGRFYPWWIRKGDTLIYKTLLNEETPDLGDWYFNPINSRKSMLIEPYTDTIDGKKITMTSAVYTVVKDNKALGIVGVDLNLKDITELVGKIKPYPESTSFLVSDGDNFVAHPNEELLNKPVNFSDSIKQIITSHEQKTAELYDSESQEDVLYTITPIPVWNLDQKWSLVVKTPLSSIMANARKALLLQILGSAVGLVALLLVVIVVARIFSKKISLLSVNLNLSSSAVSESVSTLNESGNSLADAASQAASSIEETAASVEEINSMVQTSSLNAKQAAELTAETSALAKDGNKQIQELIASMNDIATSSKKIEEIITIIEDIAFQTNLLALNASVEAARAGEHGKGFAVVAEAVQSLAQRSGSSAKDITGLIKESVRQVAEGTQKANKSGALLAAISEGIQKVANISAEIASANEEQARGIEQINKTMNHLEQVIQENNRQAQGIVSTAQDIYSQSSVMKDTVKVLNGEVSSA